MVMQLKISAIIEVQAYAAPVKDLALLNRERQYVANLNFRN